MNRYETTLLEFLSTPLGNGDALFERFAALPRAIVGEGRQPLARYVYVPGTRADRVVLVAHIDTVWDRFYKKPLPEKQTVIFHNGVFSGSDPGCGIGADDRAGCAMLWELRNCGHSLLIVDGEEYGKRGARYLKKTNRRLFRELNKHAYMIEFDWKGTDCCLYNHVDNTEKFKRYIAKTLGFVDSKEKGGTDLQVLCRHVCGVNLGIGYHDWHTPKEFLVLSEWENTLANVSAFLQKPQPRFRSKFFPPYLRLAQACVRKALRILNRDAKS